MMGFPEGWVTAHIPRRTHAIRLLGNAVVPQQALYALHLISHLHPTLEPA